MDEIDVVLSSNKELDYGDLEAVGIDTSMISVCRKLRMFARLDRVRFDTCECKGKLNRQLLNYFEFCGIDALSAVKEYISNLQPYMITCGKAGSLICVVDDLYRVSVRIEEDEEVVASFCEDMKRDLDVVQKSYTPMFADCITGKLMNENRYSVRVFIQRGLLAIPIDIMAFKCKDVFVVNAGEIEERLVGFCHNYIEGLFLSDYNLRQEDLDAYVILEQLSFTFYSKDTFSTISLLIDSLCIQTNKLMIRIADANLTTFMRNLRLSKSQREDLLKLLYTRYGVSSKRNTRALLEHISDELSVYGEGPEINLGR